MSLSPQIKVDQARDRQRLARAIENAYPRELSAFIDFIAHGHPQHNRFELHRRALEYARVNFDALATEPKP